VFRFSHNNPDPLRFFVSLAHHLHGSRPIGLGMMAACQEAAEQLAARCPISTAPQRHGAGSFAGKPLIIGSYQAIPSPAITSLEADLRGCPHHEHARSVGRMGRAIKPKATRLSPLGWGRRGQNHTGPQFLCVVLISPSSSTDDDNNNKTAVLGRETSFNRRHDSRNVDSAGNRADADANAGSDTAGSGRSVARYGRFPRRAPAPSVGGFVQ
jgi:hypothetical protein